MSQFNYSKISLISLSSSSSGMAMGSNQSLSEELSWKEDGTVVMNRTEIHGGTREVSVFAVAKELAEKIRAFAESADIAAWGELKYEEDPRFRCTDYSSRSSGRIILDYRDQGGKPYEIVSFNTMALFRHNKDADIETLREFFRKCQDPQTMIENTTSLTPAGETMLGMGMDPGTVNAFGNLQIFKEPVEASKPEVHPQPEVRPQGAWTCTCGQINEGKFCCQCGSPRVD